MLSGSLYGIDGLYNTTNFTKSLDKVNQLNNQENDLIFQSELVFSGKSSKGFLTSERFTWDVSFLHPTTRKKKTVQHVVELKDLIIAQYERGLHKKSGNDIELFPTQYFSIHYCRKTKGHKLKYHHVVFQTSESEICKKWVDSIQSSLKRFSRPKNLLFFINPVGGKKDAEKIFQSKVEPLLYIAKVRYDVVVTQRMNHAKDYLQTEEISHYDGVISVGGDGMFSEIMNGVLRFQNNRHELLTSSINDESKDIKLGIIPAGSTDTVIYCTTGTNDAATAALQIILGDELPMDVCSVWHDEEFMKYSISLMAYGYFGDIIKESEKLRWIGPKRYDFAGFKRFMVNKSYEGEIMFRCSSKVPEIIDQPQEQCKQGCKRCSTFFEEDEQEDSDDEWHTIQGRFISVLAANISCRCAKSSTGLSPHAHIGDGEIDLVLVRKTTRAKYLHHLIKVSEKTTEQFDFNFIEVHRVKEFRFKPITSSPTSTYLSPLAGTDRASNSGSINSVDSRGSSSSTSSETSVWNIDGELVDSPELSFRVHRQLIKLYARGIED